MTDASLPIRRFLARLDGTEAGDPLDLFADDVVFAIQLPGASFSGGHDELRDFLSRRDTATRRTHVVVATSEHADGVCLLLGEARDGDAVLGTFLTSTRLAADGRIARYLSTYGPGLRLAPDDPGA